ncbi:MAG: pyridoxal phosphate-dependent aminotransferase [Desulfovibrionales bacterium]|nr:pyridoxal phosphate-dependent aminotransferase [Desulfovibrionales bacterium]
MKISSRIEQLKPSATLAVNAKALDLKAQGKEIVSLAVGEPDFPTPEYVRDACKRALDEGFTRYGAVPGLPELRTAVANYFNLMYGTSARAEHTMVTNGGKQALFNLFQSLINPGDEVIIPAPYWVSYPPMVQLAEGKPVFVRASADAGFKITVEQLEAVCTEKTTMLLLNSPSNPTGAAYTRTELDAIAEWAINKGLFIVSDEIYDQLVYAPAEHASLAPWWDKYPEQICIVNGLAKSFAMTGWRIGYVLANVDLIKAMSKIQGQSTSNVCSFAQKGAVAALTGGFEVVDAMRASFRKRRDLAMSIIGKWPNVVCPVPEGAFYLFPDVHRLYNETYPDSASLCTYLLEQAGVALVPGAAFGDDNCIRISYAVDEQTLETSLNKISRILFG